MLIGIDAAPLQAPQSGIPVFARMLLSAIAAERPGWRFTAFGWSGWTPVDAARLTERPSGDNTSEALRARLVSTALGLPLLPAMRRAVRRRLFEILPLPPLDFHYALQFLPMGAIDAPVLPVIHDLAHLALPHLVHPSRRRFLDRLPDVARGAARVQAVSQFTADDVSTRFGVPRDRIDVVTPSLRTLFFEPAQTEPLTALGLAAGRYFLAAGMAEPRKNLDLLLEIAAGESSPIAPDFPLVLTGAPAWKRGKAAQTLQRLEASGAVRPLGFVPLQTLHALYAHATAFLMPSLHEGFGIPVIEALACGCRVIAADNSALPEAAGGHALLIDPHDATGWRDALAAVRETSANPEVLAAGRAHAAQFTAERSARAAIASVERFVAAQM